MKKVKKILYFANKFLFMIFVFFIPFTFFNFPNNIDPLTYPINFYVSFIGFFLTFAYTIIYMRNKFYIASFSIVFIMIVLSAVSFIFSIIQYPFFNGDYNSNLILVYVKSSIHLAHAFTLFAYVFFNFNIYYKCRNFFVHTFMISSAFLILIGILQIGIIHNIKFCFSIYDSLSFTYLLRPSSYIYKFGKICLASPEPAWITGSVLIYLIPINLFVLFSYNKKIYKVLSIVGIVSFVLFLLYSKSSQAYVSLVAYIMILFFFLAKKSQKNTKIILITFSILLVLTLAFFMLFSERFREILLKPFNIGNYSSAHRWALTLNPLLVFLKNPIFGVGTGMHSYYFFDNIIDTAISFNPETQSMLSGGLGIPIGAPFIFLFLSNYGLVGVFFIAIGIKIFKKYNGFKILNDKIKTIYIATILLFAFLSVIEEIINNYYLPSFLFMPVIFSIPVNKKNTVYKYSIVNI